MSLSAKCIRACFMLKNVKSSSMVKLAIAVFGSRTSLTFL